MACSASCGARAKFVQSLRDSKVPCQRTSAAGTGQLVELVVHGWKGRSGASQKAESAQLSS
eukprot:6208494-Prorocentrum_lima.AAC.1